jgi:hypothetical protein
MTLRDSFRFFFEHDGYVTPPGRAVCAIRTARAELAVRQRDDIRFRWEPDECPDLSWMSARELEREHYVEGCIMERKCSTCGAWESVDSLWGITDADDTYRRIIEAQLATSLE